MLLIADVGVHSALGWSDGQRAWPLVMFPAADPHVRILEFRYNAPARSGFPWTQFIDLGRVLLNCMLQDAHTYEVSELPVPVRWATLTIGTVYGATAAADCTWTWGYYCQTSIPSVILSSKERLDR